MPDGIRRIARGQLQDARDELDGTPARRLGEAVHATRKRIKRLRACVRLARDAIGERTYDRENTTLRMDGSATLISTCGCTRPMVEVRRSRSSSVRVWVDTGLVSVMP